MTGVSVATVAAVVGATAAVGGLAYTLTQGTPSMPKAEVPAVQASSPRADTGASVKLGTTIKDQRVSGSSGGRTVRSKTVDVLGNLGVSSGLNL